MKRDLSCLDATDWVRMEYLINNGAMLCPFKAGPSNDCFKCVAVFPTLDKAMLACPCDAYGKDYVKKEVLEIIENYKNPKIPFMRY